MWTRMQLLKSQGGGERQGQNDCMLKLFHFKEHLSEASSGTLLMEVKHHGRRDVNLGPLLPLLYVLCVKENYSYIPTMDFMFATALLIGINTKTKCFFFVSSWCPFKTYIHLMSLASSNLNNRFPQLFFFKSNIRHVWVLQSSIIM